jgi:hypothetical protein
MAQQAGKEDDRERRRDIVLSNSIYCSITSPYFFFYAALMLFAAFSATAYTVLETCPLIAIEKIDVSTIRRPLVPYTFNSWSTTPPSLLGSMPQLDMGYCHELVANVRIDAATSLSVETL